MSAMNHPISLVSMLVAQEDTGGAGIFSYALLPLMLVAMYFLIIRPSRKKAKDQAALQSALGVGDQVMTTSGIIGTITGEDGPTRFWVEIDDDVQVRMARGGISGRIEGDLDAEDADEVADSDAGAESADRD